jgi:hypothetical protein
MNGPSLRYTPNALVLGEIGEHEQRAVLNFFD